MRANAEIILYYNDSNKLATSDTGITVTGTVTETSDIAYKSDIKPITNTLDKIQQITGYKYKLDNASIDSMGVIAQDVEKVFPELVHGDEGNKTLQYSGLIGVLVDFSVICLVKKPVIKYKGAMVGIINNIDIIRL